MKKDSIIINALILFAITLISGFLLGLTYNATQEARDYQTKLKTDVALNTVLNNAKFIEMPIEGEPVFITKVYQGNTAEDGSGDELGYAFQLETTEGYGDAINLMVAFNIDGTISGIDIVSHSETPGLGAKADEPLFKDQFIGKAVSTLTVTKGGTNPSDVDAIGGATITSRAVTNAVNEAIDYYNTMIKKEGK
jgi:electron transport complex protein RnfG